MESMIINQIKRPWIKTYNRTPEAYYQSSEWKNLVNMVWQRDNSVCQLCKEKGILHQLERGTKDLEKQGTVDHRRQRKKGGTDTMDNLWLIGSNHHASKSADEGNKMKQKG